MPQQFSDVSWVVLKFGGTSVSSRARWNTIAKLARDKMAGGENVLIVVSALSGVTDQLKSLCEAFQDDALTGRIKIADLHVE